MKRKLCFMFINVNIETPQRQVMPVGDDGEMILLGVGSMADAVTEAGKLAEEGIAALELCGGFGVIGHARIKEAVGDACIVGAVRFDHHPGYGGISGDDKWL